MNVPLKAVTGSKRLDGNLEAIMREIGREARQAAKGFSPPQQYVSQRILKVFNQSGS